MGSGCGLLLTLFAADADPPEGSGAAVVDVSCCTPPPVALPAAVVMVEFWFERQMPATVRGVVLSDVLQQSGDRTHLLSAALRGCKRSGERARRSSGELGSAVLARGNPFFVGGVGDPPMPPATIPGTTADGSPVTASAAAVGNPPGLYDCVVLDAPSGCTTGNASGLDERVGEAGSGDGLGVRASGDSGIWSADFRRFEGRPPAAAAEWSALLLAHGDECSLCLRTCSVEGRWYSGAPSLYGLPAPPPPLPVGVLGADVLGEPGEGTVGL
uniref:Uncharacterized protein n=1 Tax=Anopheles melas TaxID=34690 RepID=A0A182TFK8_9DIPT